MPAAAPCGIGHGDGVQQLAGVGVARPGEDLRHRARLHEPAGPEDGYPVGVWRSTVDGEYVRYSRPQAYGNHTDTRWATLSDGRRRGLLVAGDLDVSVTPYDALDRAGALSWERTALGVMDVLARQAAPRTP